MLNWNDSSSNLLIARVLHDDELVLASSDTVLGLFAQLSEKSKQQLDLIKHRNLKPYIVLIRSVELLHKFTDQVIDDKMQQIMNKFWPGPLTIIFKAKSTLPDWMVSSNKTIAIRIPCHDGLQGLLQQFEGLFTTSANISDQPIPHKYDEVDSKILNRVRLVCCQTDIKYDSPASTIIDFTSGSIKIIRSGAVRLDSI
jgi:L-threonylcarbamoyladenylate synthase